MAGNMTDALDSLREARVLVVGGSSGIGLAVARMAAAQGAAVTIAGRDLSRARAAAGAAMQAASVDIRDEDAVADFCAAEPPFHHVVVTAAQVRAGFIRELSVAAARAMFDSKFWGSYHVARHARFVGAGSLTFVSGAAARSPRPGRAQLAAATAAIEALTRALAVEFAPVRVNCISPGIVDTPMLRAARTVTDAPLPQPVPRPAEPAEIALQILAAMVNGFMTGSVIDVDGGINLARAL